MQLQLQFQEKLCGKGVSTQAIFKYNYNFKKKAIFHLSRIERFLILTHNLAPNFIKLSFFYDSGIGAYVSLHTYILFEQSWKLLNAMHLSNFQWKDLQNTLLKQHFCQNRYTKLSSLISFLEYTHSKCTREESFVEYVST